jgi:glycosyltransferase involved in cell wall biosynthesis
MSSKRDRGSAAERVMFCGFRKDALNLYPALDIVALTSRNGGTPLTLIEAMACGRPVVTTEVGGVVDLLGMRRGAGEGSNVWDHGLGVASDDAEGLFRAIAHLIHNPALGVDLGRRAQGFIASRFSKERLISDMTVLYDGLLSDDVSPRPRSWVTSRECAGSRES